MPHRQLKTRTDCEDFVRGCNIMGLGGGGWPEIGLKYLLEGLSEGLVLEWIDVDDIADDSWTATVLAVGTMAPDSDEAKAEIEKIGIKPIMAGKEMEAALTELADYAGVTLSAMVPCELGATNTPVPMVAAARINLPVVDADYSGRAVPEWMQATPFLFNKPSYPCASVDEWGNVCIIKEAQGHHLFERVSKMLSVAAYGRCYTASNLLSGKETKDIVIRDTLTYSLELGAAVREAREKGDDPVAAIVDFTGGWLLFTGEVQSKDWADAGGTMRGTTYIKGSGDWKGHTFRYWFMNENHIGWRDDGPVITSPDLPIVVDIETGEGMINTYIDAGDRVAVIGAKGPVVFRSENGLNGTGPRYYGFDIDYIPIEERMATSE
jgi:DUF917 family protein